MARLTKYTTPALIGVVLTLAAAVYVLHVQNIGLLAEIEEMRAASASYKKTIEQKIAKTEKEHEQSKNDIDSRYSDIINRLREQQANNGAHRPKRQGEKRNNPEAK